MTDTPKIPDLPVAEVNEFLTDKDCPGVSICIPCFKRRKFLPLIMNNLFYMDYPRDKIEINILQDGPEDLMVGGELEYFKKQLAPSVITYKYESGIRRNIGDKRNRLVKIFCFSTPPIQSWNNFFCFYDFHLSRARL